MQQKSIAVGKQDEKSISLNSWKTALYQSIIDSEWYWNEYLPEICKGKD